MNILETLLKQIAEWGLTNLGVVDDFWLHGTVIKEEVTFRAFIAVDGTIHHLDSLLEGSTPLPGHEYEAFINVGQTLLTLASLALQATGEPVPQEYRIYVSPRSRTINQVVSYDYLNDVLASAAFHDWYNETKVAYELLHALNEVE